LPARHRIALDTFHYKWDRSHKPVLNIEDGDEVTLEINDVWSWSIKKSWKSSDLTRLDPEKLYPLAGPIYVEGAKPGDALIIDVLDMSIGDFGWTVIMPDSGILEEFKQPYLYKWDLKDKRFGRFRNGIKIPIRPFCGVMGVAPKKEGSFPVAPPGKHAGNLDIKHLIKGSSLKIPVWVPGALFSAGDIHAAMGDGEVCISAIECPGTARLRFSLEKKAAPKWPRYSTPGDKPSKKGYYAATGIATDLMTATKESVRNMISYLTEKYGLTPEDAYVLCSVAADVRVHEVVDKPNWVVGTMVPLDIFPD
jgi:acetamidase/formamidase